MRYRYNRYGFRFGNTELEQIVPEFTLKIQTLIAKKSDQVREKLTAPEIAKYYVRTFRRMVDLVTRSETEIWTVYLHALLKQLCLLYFYSDRFFNFEKTTLILPTPTGTSHQIVRADVIKYPYYITLNDPTTVDKLVLGILKMLFNCFNINTINFGRSILLRKIKYTMSIPPFVTLFTNIFKNNHKKHQDDVLHMMKTFTLSLDPESLRTEYVPEVHAGKRHPIVELNYFAMYWSDNDHYNFLMLYLERYPSPSDSDTAAFFILFIREMTIQGYLEESAFDEFIWVVCNLIKVPRGPLYSDVNVIGIIDDILDRLSRKIGLIRQ